MQKAYLFLVLFLLARVSLGQTVSFSYDASGNRISRSASSGPIYSLSVSGQTGLSNVISNGGSGSFVVNSTNVNWSISNLPSWASVSQSSGGNGSTTVTVTVAGNSSTTARTQALSITGANASAQSLTISQVGASGGGGCPVDEVAIGTSGTNIVCIKHWNNNYVLCEKYVVGSTTHYIPRGKNYWSNVSRYANVDQYYSCIDESTTGWGGLACPLATNYTIAGWTRGTFPDGGVYYIQNAGGCTSPAPNLSSSSGNGYADLTAGGCNGTVTWNTGSTGATLRVNNTGTYRATCTLSGCTPSVQSSISVTVTGGGTGSLSRKYWVNNAINSSLTSLTPFLGTTPTGTDNLTQGFRAYNWANGGVPLTDWADNYGELIEGYITPTQSGNYTFWISSDDNSELWLSSNNSPNNATKIAFVSGWTGWDETTREGNQKSATIYLQAGTPYYVKALHTEGGGGDNLVVRWALNNSSTPTEIVPARVLSPYSGGVSTSYALTIGTTTNLSNIVSNGGSGSFVVNSTNVNWSISNLPSWASVSPSSGGNGPTTVTVTVTGNSSTTARTQALSITGANASAQSLTISQVGASGGGSTGSGSLSRKYWVNNAINSSLTSLTPFLGTSPTGTDNLTQGFRAYNWANGGVPLTDWADNYGELIEGYITPTQSGNYTFWISSDDNSELWLSSNNSPNNATKIAFVSGWTGWDETTRESNQKSVSVTLQAGTAYYVKALHTEGGGGDNLVVRWALNNSSTPTEIVPARVLSPYSGGTTTTTNGCGNSPQNYCADGTITSNHFRFRTNNSVSTYKATIAGPKLSLDMGVVPFYGNAGWLQGYTGCSSCEIYPYTTDNINLPLGSYRIDVGFTSTNTIKIYVNGTEKWASVRSDCQNGCQIYPEIFSSVQHGDRVYLSITSGVAARMSKEELIQLEPESSILKISPNPTNGAIKAVVNLSEEEPFRLSIVDMQGNTLRSYDIAGKAGNNELPLDLHQERAGVYFVRLQLKNNQLVSKVIKID